VSKIPRTLAMRVLDARKIPYEVHLFPDTIRDAEIIAAEVGIPPEQMFKTLVVVPEHDAAARPLLVMIPANAALDLRALARAVGMKSLRMATHSQAEQLTGLKVGGIGALALLNRPFSVYLDASAEGFEQIYVSGGQRGVDLQLAVRDLVAVTGATLLAGITVPKDA
jgi:Cys-tRNA(Pro)/Cys-tRNA(Cys) deacylase